MLKDNRCLHFELTSEEFLCELELPLSLPLGIVTPSPRLPGDPLHCEGGRVAYYPFTPCGHTHIYHQNPYTQVNGCLTSGQRTKNMQYNAKPNFLLMVHFPADGTTILMQIVNFMRGSNNAWKEVLKTYTNGSIFDSHKGI